MRRLIAALAASCLLATLPLACGSTGGVVFGITSELSPGASFTSMHANISTDGAVLLDQTFDGGELKFPMELDMPDLEDESTIRLELTAFQGDVPIVTRVAQTQAAAGRTMLYEVKIESECVAVACDEGETCVEGQCVDAFTAAADLPDYYSGWAGGSGGGRCEPGGDPTVLVGSGQSDYHEVEDGDVLQVEAGPQGGYHVWVAARMKNISQSGSVTELTGTFVDVDYTPAPMSVIFTFDPDEGGFCKVYGLRFRLDDADHPIETLLGKSLNLTVTVTDQDGDTASSTRTIKLSDDYI